METIKDKSEKRIAARIRELQTYLQSFRDTAFWGEFIINGMRLDKIPFDPWEAKKRIKREICDLIIEEITRLQVIEESNGDIPGNEIISEPETVGKYNPGEPDPEINIPAAVNYLLSEKYFSEFKVIDNLQQHPRGFNFSKWLKFKKLVNE